MRFSEAMLLGLPEIRFTNTAWLCTFGVNPKCDGCLIGAALYAIGRREDVYDSLVVKLVQDQWPWTKIFDTTIVKCPGCCIEMVHVDVASIMTHLAEHYGGAPYALSAERIADFIKSFELEEVEPQQRPAPTWEEIELIPESKAISVGG